MNLEKQILCREIFKKMKGFDIGSEHPDDDKSNMPEDIFSFLLNSNISVLETILSCESKNIMQEILYLVFNSTPESQIEKYLEIRKKDGIVSILLTIYDLPMKKLFELYTKIDTIENDVKKTIIRNVIRDTDICELINLGEISKRQGLKAINQIASIENIETCKKASAILCDSHLLNLIEDDKLTQMMCFN